MARRSVGRILRINVTVPLWLVIVLTVVGVTAAYFCAPSCREHLKFVTLLVAGAAGIYSAYYVGAALRLNLDREKQKASFEILGLLNRPEFVQVALLSFVWLRAWLSGRESCLRRPLTRVGGAVLGAF